MQRRAASALAAGLFVAIGCASSSAQVTEGTTPDSTCAKGSLHTIYQGAHRCLGLASRKRIYAGVTRQRDRGLTGLAAYRAVSSRFRVAVADVRRIDREGRARGWPLPAAYRLAAGTPILAAGGEEAATGLAATVDCSGTEPGLAIASLRWTPAAVAGREQRVQVAILEDGFERGDYEASAALGAGRDAIAWARVHGRAFHFWRVLTLQADGWRPSATQRFAGVACIYDQTQP